MSKKPDIRPYSKKELALLYEMSTHCFTTMIAPFENEIGKKKGWYYNVNQIVTIFRLAGYPGALLQDEYVSKEKRREMDLNDVF